MMAGWAQASEADLTNLCQTDQELGAQLELLDDHPKPATTISPAPA